MRLYSGLLSGGGLPPGGVVRAQFVVDPTSLAADPLTPEDAHPEIGSQDIGALYLVDYSQVTATAGPLQGPPSVTITARTGQVGGSETDVTTAMLYAPPALSGDLATISLTGAQRDLTYTLTLVAALASGQTLDAATVVRLFCPA